MSLSIIIPACNAAAHIAATLDSLQPLRSRGAEIIVINGSSSDETVNLARSRVDQLLEVAGGNAQQLNAGAAAAHGEIFCFLPSNAQLPEAADSLMIAGLSRNRRSWGCFSVRSASTHPLQRMAALLINYRVRFTGIADAVQGIFVTRSLFEAAGRFPETARRPDLAFSRQLRVYGPPLRIRHSLIIP